MASSHSEPEGLPIDEILALAKAGQIYLKKVETKAGKVPATTAGGQPKPTTRYFWNRKDHTGSIRIVIGDAFKPKEKQPFLLATPSKFDEKSISDTMGAFTSIPDHDEATCWKEFSDWMGKQLIAQGIFDTKKGPPAPEQIPIILASKIEPIVKVPDDATDDAMRVTMSQKLNTGTNPLLATKCQFLTISPEGIPELGDYFPFTDLAASRNVFTVVELGEASEKLQKWRTMMYIRNLYAFPAAAAKPATFRMGKHVIDASAAKKSRSSGGDAATAAGEDAYGAQPAQTPYEDTEAAPACAPAGYDDCVAKFAVEGGGGGGEDEGAGPETTNAAPGPAPSAPVPATPAVPPKTKAARRSGGAAAAPARAEISVASLEE